MNTSKLVRRALAVTPAIVLAILIIKKAQVEAVRCESPKYSTSSYSTLDGFFHFTTTYIVEFALQCSNNIRDTQFYAVIDGTVHHVATSEETSKYQVSWQREHSDSGSQTIDVHIYDEEGIVDYRKSAEAAGGDNAKALAAVKPLFTVAHRHAGVSKKTPISSETVLLLVAGVAVYYATRLKAQFSS